MVLRTYTSKKPVYPEENDLKFLSDTINIALTTLQFNHYLSIKSNTELIPISISLSSLPHRFLLFLSPFKPSPFCSIKFSMYLLNSSLKISDSNPTITSPRYSKLITSALGFIWLNLCKVCKGFKGYFGVGTDGI